MELISKLIYQARRHGLDVIISDDVVIKNITTKKHVMILPNGKIFSEDILGHDKDLKGLMPNFIVKDPLLYSGSFLSLPCEVSLHVGKDTSNSEINFAIDCLTQSFENIKNFNVVKDDNLLQHECKIEHKYALSFKERQAFINACLEYLK